MHLQVMNCQIEIWLQHIALYLARRGYLCFGSTSYNAQRRTDRAISLPVCARPASRAVAHCSRTCSAANPERLPTAHHMDLERQLGCSAAQFSVFRLKFQKLFEFIITAPILLGTSIHFPLARHFWFEPCLLRRCRKFASRTIFRVPCLTLQ